MDANQCKRKTKPKQPNDCHHSEWSEAQKLGAAVPQGAGGSGVTGHWAWPKDIPWAARPLPFIPGDTGYEEGAEELEKGG